MLPTAPKKSQFADEIGACYGEIQYRVGKVLQRYRVSGGNVRLSMALYDTYIVIPARNAHSREAELDHVAEWALRNNLKLNRVKSTEVIFVDHRR